VTSTSSSIGPAVPRTVNSRETALLGYLAGIPTYTLSAELASCRPLRGDVPTARFPAKLAAAAPPVWRFCRSFSLDYARMHARRCNAAGAMGQAAAAVMQEAHAIVCERSEWVCNEKRLIETAGLTNLHALFAQVPNEPANLVRGSIGSPINWEYRGAKLRLGNDANTSSETGPGGVG
jgi:hypothetical protein